MVERKLSIYFFIKIRTRSKKLLEMAAYKKVFNEHRRLLTEYVTHRDYFSGVVLNENDIGPYEFRLNEMLQLVPTIKNKKTCIG